MGTIVESQCHSMSRTQFVTVAAVAVLIAPVPLAAQLVESACPSREIGAPAIPAQDTMRAPSVARDTARANASVTDGRGPAIVLYASASAREVRFAAQPRIVVRLCGGVMDSVRVLERRNLPDPVQPGVTYRDVFVAVEILGHLNASCIASKLGAAPTRGADPCASLQIRDSAAIRRPPP